MSNNTHYLALTIGPIYKTIHRARKTRELWVSSYLLSHFMRLLLTQIKANNLGDVLSPNLDELDTQNNGNKTWHGAGIWNDSCFVELRADQLEVAKDKLPEIIRSAKSELLDKILSGISTDTAWKGFREHTMRELLDKHFHCHAVIWERTDENEPIIKNLNKIIQSVESLEKYPAQHDDYVSKALFRAGSIRKLYDLGFEKNDGVFTFYDGHKKRMPSLLEIALRQYRKNKVFYDENIAAIISENSKNNDDLENEKEEREIIGLLKSEKNTTGIPFKKRHKYVAVIQADGDGIGKVIERAAPNEVKSISEALMKFSTDAVEKIYTYDGVPIYAGGDDLLFIAPLWNQKDQTVFHLLDKIQEAWKKSELPNESSISFGVSIFYYKDPLGEQLKSAYNLLTNVAKRLKTEGSKKNAKEKDAIAIRVMLHSGQAFAATLHKSGDAWTEWMKLMTKHTGSVDTAFVAGVIHTLERLGWLLDDACKHGRTEAFFEHHFNEAKGIQKDFIYSVKKLAEAIHNEYNTLFPKSDDDNEPFYLALQQDRKIDSVSHEIQFRNNLLYAALRMIQFLNAEDHE